MQYIGVAIRFFPELITVTRFSYDLQADMHGGSFISSSHLDGEGSRSNIWGQAVQYIDEVPAEKVSRHALP